MNCRGEGSVAKMERVTERERTEQELVQIAYRKGRADFARLAIEEITKVHWVYDDDFSKGVNYAVDRAIDIIERLEKEG